MPIVKNGNRTLTVEESTVDVYLKQGYDQVELSEDGKSYVVVKRATGGKQVSYAEYVTLLEEKEELEQKVAEGGDTDLAKENKSLKTKITKLEKELEEIKANGEGGGK